MATFTVQQIVFMVAIAVALAMLVVLLGGVSRLEDDKYTSSRSLGYIWWSLFFQLFIIVAMIVGVLMNFLKRITLLVSIFLAMSAVVLMQVTDGAVTANHDAKLGHWDTKSAWSSVLAGALVNVIVNLFLIIFFNLPEDLIAIRANGDRTVTTQHTPAGQATPAVTETTVYTREADVAPHGEVHVDLPVASKA